jgi:hypothetical protein
MITISKTENGSEKKSQEQNQRILSFFNKKHKVKYNKRLSRKLRFYVGEKIEKQDISNVLSQYRTQMQ